MTESFPGGDRHDEYREESLPPREVVGLHGQIMEVPTGTTPVMPKEVAALRYGIPGDVLVVMRFPLDEEAQLAKEVALVDYGQGVGEENTVPSTIVRTAFDRESATVTTRYGLLPFNYVPHSSSGYVAVPPGREVMVGSGLMSVAGKDLGMWGATEVGNAGISPAHLTVELGEDSFTISDHSDVGTVVMTAVPPEVRDYWRS